MSDYASEMGGGGRRATTDHDVIRSWADDRHATPATAPGAADSGGLRELHLDLGLGDEFHELQPVTWDQWFAAFDERGLEFVYQEGTRPDGSRSNDFHLVPRGQTTV